MRSFILTAHSPILIVDPTTRKVARADRREVIGYVIAIDSHSWSIDTSEENAQIFYNIEDVATVETFFQLEGEDLTFEQITIGRQ